jgi:hypothetical protein
MSALIGLHRGELDLRELREPGADLLVVELVVVGNGDRVLLG